MQVYFENYGSSGVAPASGVAPVDGIPPGVAIFALGTGSLTHTLEFSYSSRDILTCGAGGRVCRSDGGTPSPRRAIFCSTPKRGCKGVPPPPRSSVRGTASNFFAKYYTAKNRET